MTAKQSGVLAFLLLLLVLSVGPVTEVFTADRLQAEARHRDCFEKRYGMEPNSFYEQNGLYPKCPMEI